MERTHIHTRGADTRTRTHVPSITKIKCITVFEKNKIIILAHEKWNAEKWRETNRKWKRRTNERLYELRLRRRRKLFVSKSYYTKEKLHSKVTQIKSVRKTIDKARHSLSPSPLPTSSSSPSLLPAATLGCTFIISIRIHYNECCLSVVSRSIFRNSSNSINWEVSSSR